MKYFVDGNSQEKYDGNFMAWRVVDKEGTVYSTFFGPMSRFAALSFCRDLNNNTLEDVANFDYDLRK